MKLRSLVSIILSILIIIPDVSFADRKALKQPRKRQTIFFGTDISPTIIAKTKLFQKSRSLSGRKILKDRMLKWERENKYSSLDPIWLNNYLKRLDARFLDAESPNVDRYLNGFIEKRHGLSVYLSDSWRYPWHNNKDYVYATKFQYIAFADSDPAVYPLKEDTQYELNQNILKYNTTTYYNPLNPLKYGDTDNKVTCFITPAYNELAFSDYIISKDRKKTYHFYNGFSVAYPNLYPKIFWPYTNPVDSTIGYLGMIDDDLPYDYEKNGFKGEVKPVNEDAPFIYVYDYDEFRKHNMEWYSHDTVTYGFMQEGDDLEDMEKIYYGPMTEDPNIYFIRAIRAAMFIRMELAKRDLVSGLHPAPLWDESIGDYDMDYDKRINPKNLSSEGQKLYEFSKMSETQMHAITSDRVSEYFGDLDCMIERSPKEYEKIVREASNDAYWALFLNFNSYDYHIAETIYNKDWKAAARKGRELERYQILRRYYMYKTYVRSPRQYQEDYLRYFNNDTISVALWAGQNSYGYLRHTSEVSQKFLFPYYDVKDKPGNTYGPRLRGPYKWAGECEYMFKYGFSHDNSNPSASIREFTGTPSNTTGLIYAGHFTKDELKEYCKLNNRTPEQVWKSALKGPYMIISSRTYKRYGVEYFNRMAGRKLKAVDVTGSLQQCYVNVYMDHDKVYNTVKRIMGMDPFYVKTDVATPLKIWNNHVVKDASGDTGPFGKVNLESFRAEPRDYVMPVKITDKYDPIDKPKEFVNKYNKIAKDIEAALAKDDQMFPHMSQRYANYIEYFPGEPYDFQRPEEIIYRARSKTEPVMGAYFNAKRKDFPFLVDGFDKHLVPRWKDMEWNEEGRTWMDLDNRYRTMYDKFIDEEVRKRSPRGIEVFSRIWRDKKRNTLETIKVKGGDYIYELQKYLADNIPWMAYNPNLYICYYKYAADLIVLDEDLFWGKDFDKRFRMYYNDGRLAAELSDHDRDRNHAFDEHLYGIGDGVMPVGYIHVNIRSVFIADDIINDDLKDNHMPEKREYLKYMMGYFYTDHIYYAEENSLASGKMRKRLIPSPLKEDLFQEPELTISDVVMSTSGISPYRTIYKSMKNHNGVIVRGTRVIGDGMTHDRPASVARIYSDVLPGMILFPNTDYQYNQAYYARARGYNNSKFEDTPWVSNQYVIDNQINTRDCALAYYLYDSY